MWEGTEQAEALKKRRREHRLFQERMAAVVRRLGETGDGIAFLRFLLEESGLLKAQFPEGHAEAAWREGRRSLGLQVLLMARQAGIIDKLLQEEKDG